MIVLTKRHGFDQNLKLQLVEYATETYGAITFPTDYIEYYCILGNIMNQYGL